MSEGKNLWEAIGELRRTRRDLMSQLARVVREEGSDAECSFCGGRPPHVAVVPGPDASICDRCVGVCAELLEISREPE